MASATKAVSYLRVSGQGQVDGDGFTRQGKAVSTFARQRGFELVGEFRDEGVSGTVGIADRPGLMALVERILGNGVRVVLVEKADRLARDLVEGELILRELRRHEVRVIECEGGTDLSDGDDNPTAKLIRQVLGAVAEFEKSALVAKLRVARERKRKAEGRCEGVKPFGHFEGEPETIALIRKLRRKPRGKPRRTWAAIAEALTTEARPSRSGKPWNAEMVRSLVRNLEG